MPPTKLNAEQKKALLEAKVDDWRSVALVLPEGFSKTAANGIRKRAGRAPFPVKFQMRHSYNESFFYDGGVRAAYWAGFIAADGNIYKPAPTRAVLAIGLSRADREHLETFLSDIGGGRVYDGKHDTKGVECLNSFVNISNLKICTSLEERFNITERKSLTLVPPEDLLEKERIAFIAGYIDGDGAYSYSPYKDKKYPNITILGTKKMLSWICMELGYPNKTLYNRSNIFAVKFNTQDALAVRDRLYTLDGEIPFLPRKYKRWESLGIDVNGIRHGRLDI